MPIKKLLHNIIRPKVSGLVGIDINANSIRLVEISYFESNYQVEACINIALENPTSDKMIITALKKIIEQNSLKTKDAAVALSHTTVIIKEIEVEKGLTDKEIEDFLQFNIERYTGELTSNISFDYYTIDTPVKTSPHIILRLIMIRREYVEECVKLLQATSLCPKIADIDSYALERVVRHQFKNIVGLIAIINIDHGTILIVVIDYEKTVYVHKDLISDGELDSPSQIVMQLKLKVQPVFSTLHQPIEKIILSGEKATFAGLIEAIHIQFNIQVIILNPFLGMKLSSAVSDQLEQKMARAMAISCGLALRVNEMNSS